MASAYYGFHDMFSNLSKIKNLKEYQAEEKPKLNPIDPRFRSLQIPPVIESFIQSIEIPSYILGRAQSMIDALERKSILNRFPERGRFIVSEYFLFIFLSTLIYHFLKDKSLDGARNLVSHFLSPGETQKYDLYMAVMNPIQDLYRFMTKTEKTIMTDPKVLDQTFNFTSEEVVEKTETQPAQAAPKSNENEIYPFLNLIESFFDFLFLEYQRLVFVFIEIWYIFYINTAESENGFFLPRLLELIPKIKGNSNDRLKLALNHLKKMFIGPDGKVIPEKTEERRLILGGLVEIHNLLFPNYIIHVQNENEIKNHVELLRKIYNS